MKDVLCDILPDCDGWTYELAGRASARFHTYDLAFAAAVTAARDRAARVKFKGIVIRRQDLQGQMREVLKEVRAAALVPHH
jgi:hypothetical protein